MRASPLESDLSLKRLSMASIRNPNDLKNWAIGSDSDIGGFSQAKLELYPENSPDAGKGRFLGSLSSRVQAGMKIGGSKVDRSGYAGMRTRVCRSFPSCGRSGFTERKGASRHGTPYLEARCGTLLCIPFSRLE